MSDPVDLNTVEHVARLARLELTAEQAAESARHLASILKYVDQLSELQIANDVEPFFGATEMINAIRPDVVCESTARETILDNAPDSDGEFYRVPPVFK